MYDLKLETMVNSSEARILRAQQRRYERRSNKFIQRHTNSNDQSLRINYDLQQVAYLQRERALLRREQRYLLLVRAMVSGKAYRTVEQSTREGNEVNARELRLAAAYWGYDFNQHVVTNWLTARAA